MNSIIYDEEIITPKNNKWEYYYDLAKKLKRRDSIKFSLFCAKIVGPNTKESNLCIRLVEKWLKNAKSVTKHELKNAASNTYAATIEAAYSVAFAANAANAVAVDFVYSAVYAAVVAAVNSTDNINIINKYLQILLRKTKQFQNNKILEQISKTDVDKLELVDWNMITDIMQEDYDIIHEFSYEDIFSRRCLIELLRREYT